MPLEDRRLPEGEMSLVDGDTVVLLGLSSSDEPEAIRGEGESVQRRDDDEWKAQLTASIAPALEDRDR